MTYVTRDSEAGNIIDRFATEAEAIAAVEAYEEEDRKNGIYEPGFYEVAQIEDSGVCIDKTKSGYEYATYPGVGEKVVNKHGVIGFVRPIAGYAYPQVNVIHDRLAPHYSDESQNYNNAETEIVSRAKFAKMTE